VSVCLDSWAVLAWLDGESPAFDRLEEVVPTKPVMSWVNAVEVYYRVERDHGRADADDVLRELRPLIDLDLPGTGRMVETARLKASLPIALGDCFAIATAAARGVPLLTGDAEILDRADVPCALEDLRPH
jgi:predicted nucleic acid-binding protein